MACTALWVFPAQAFSQELSVAAAEETEASGLGLGDIVVTARKREENLQDTPVAISVVGAEALENKSVTDVVALTAGIPNVQASSGSQGSSDANFFIRGVGQTDFIITSEPGVALYIDGVYIARTVGALVDSPDVSRIEILRGPQGTLFGRNAIGGAVSVVTQEPQLNEFNMRASATVGSRNRYDGDISFNAPIGDRTAVRFLALTRNQDGWGKRVSDGVTFGDVQRLAFRAAVKSEVTDTLTLRLNADYLKDDGSSQPSISRGTNSLGLPPGVSIPPGIDDQSNPPWGTVTNDIDPISRVRAGGVSLIGELDLGDITVKSISAYRELRAFSNSDYDGTSFSLYNQSSDTRQNQVSQELQLLGSSDNFDWVIGAFYMREDADQIQNLCIASAPFPNAGICGFWLYENHQKTDSYAVYGEANYDVTPNLSITLGGRYSYDKKQLRAVQNFNFTAFGGPILIFAPNPAVPGATGLASDNWGAFTPRIGINYKASTDTLLYGTYSRGFRSGGFNGRLAAPGPIRSFNPDKNDTFEFGVKTDVLDRTARINLAVFYSQYKDIQLRITDPVVQFYVANAAKADLYGAELEFTARPSDNFQFDMNVGYTHSEFKEVSPALAPARVFKGNQLGETPEWTVAVGAQYELPLADGSAFMFRTDYNWRSERFFQPANESLDLQKAYGLLNARISWTNASEKFKLAIFGTNLGKVKYFSYGEDARFNQGVAYAVIGRPREFGATLSYAF